jgi:hypothetical protein
MQPFIPFSSFQDYIFTCRTNEPDAEYTFILLDTFQKYVFGSLFEGQEIQPSQLFTIAKGEWRGLPVHKGRACPYFWALRIQII